MRKYDAVFFDLDGTLSESGEGILWCVRRTIEDLKIVVPENFRLESFIGPPLADSFIGLALMMKRLSLVLKLIRAIMILRASI